MPLSRKHSSSARSAYTLVEVLIVMGIIVLAITLAIPAIRSLTGSKSTQAAQNTIQAYLARARTDAIGLQSVHGVLFYIDPATDRVNAIEVMEVPPEVPTTPPIVGQQDLPGVTYLDIMPDRDALPLPPGLRLRTIKDLNHDTLTYTDFANNAPQSAPAAGSPIVLASYRYLGFNTTFGRTAAFVRTKTALGGVILFDGSGRVTTRRYGFKFMLHPFSGSNLLTTLGQLAQPTGFPPPGNDWPSQTIAPTDYLSGQVAFVVYNRDEFNNQNPGIGDGNPTSPTQNTKVDPWMDKNTTLLFVNRYAGTLTRAE